MSDKTMTVTIRADDSKFKPVMKSVEAAAKAAGGNIEKSFNRAATNGTDRMTASLNGMMKAAGGFIALNLSIAAIKSMNEAQLSQVRATTEVTSAYRNMGTLSSSLMQNTINLSNEMMKLVNVEDEVTLSNIAMMVNIGRLSTQQIPAATKAAIGLASAYKIDLETAFKLVGKAAAGNTTALSRYGLVLSEGMSKQEKFNAVLKMGERGFAQEMERATDAKVIYQQLGLQVGELKEAIGGLSTVPIALKGAKEATNLIEKLSNAINGYTEALKKNDQLKLAEKIVGKSATYNQLSGSAGAGLAGGGFGAQVRYGTEAQQAVEDAEKIKKAMDIMGNLKVNLPIYGETPGFGVSREDKLKMFMPFPTADEIEEEGKKEISAFKKYTDEYNKLILDQLGFGKRALSVGMHTPPELSIGQFNADKTGFNSGKTGIEGLGQFAPGEEYRQAQESMDAYYTDMENKTEWEIENKKWLQGLEFDWQKQQQEDLKAQENAWVSFGDTIANTMMYAMQQSGNAFSNMAKAFEGMLVNMAAQYAARAAVFTLLNAISGGGFGGIVSMSKFVLGDLAGKAAGGPVTGNRPYVVGERGPEIFIPNASGKIIPSIPEYYASQKPFVPNASGKITQNNSVSTDNSSWSLHFYDSESRGKMIGLPDQQFAEQFRRCVRDEKIKIKQVANG